jgi:hypothetical protein
MADVRGPQFDDQPAPAEGLPFGIDSDREAELREKFTAWDVELQSKWGAWREDAVHDYDMAAGHQWDPNEREKIEANNKIPVVFNIIGPTLDAVAGAEIANRQEAQYYPRTPDKTGVSDVLTQSAQYVNDQCNGDQEDSEAFYDCLICGVGWTLSAPDIDGRKVNLIKERVDPLQIMADASSRKPNFEDARYLKREQPMSRDAFEDLLIDFGRPDIDPEGNTGIDTGKRVTIVNPQLRYTHGMLAEGGTKDEVLVCEWQWWEKQTVFLAAMPHPTAPGVTQITKLQPPDFAKALKVKPGLKHTRSTEKAYYRAICADDQIIHEEQLPEGEFRYKAITGKRDRNKGTWYGLVRAMLDPQKFTNKLYAEILHIVRTNANGGLIMEEDAVADIRKFESTWSAADQITWTKPGSLSNANGAKIQPKSPVPINPSLFSLMEFAKDMVQACTGVNEEILGLVGREQPGVLEAQRKQAAYGILSAFFDAKRRYQRDQGRLLLAQMKIFLPGSTMVRILDQGTAQYIPIARALGAGEFDVIVDEAPTGPNQKAKVMAALGPMLPMMFQAGIIGAEQVADLLPFMDIPASVADKLGMAIRQRAQVSSQPSPQAQIEQQAQLQQFQSEQRNREADTQDKLAHAQKTGAEAANMGAKVQMEGVKALAGVAQKKAEMQMDAQQHGQDMQQSDQRHRQKLQQQADQAAQAQQQSQASHEQDMQQAQQQQQWRQPPRVAKPFATEPQPGTSDEEFGNT